MAVIVACCALASVSLGAAQERSDRLDPLLRAFRDPVVAARVNAAPRVAEAARAAGLPLDSVIVLSREAGRAETYVDAFVSLTERSPDVIASVGGEVRVEAGTLFGARVPVSALAALEVDPRVRYIRAAHRVSRRNDLAMVDVRASLVRTLSGNTFTGATGSGVIVGIVDGGIDWFHPDFKRPDGSSRILYIWDLTASGTMPGLIDGQYFGRGNECSAAVIDAGSCFERDFGGHGSHVAGIAAGDGSAAGLSPTGFQYTGVAPDADIIAVKAGEGAFSSLNILEGIQYIFKRANVLGRPAVVNLSLGGQFGPHDGSRPEEQAIDSLSGPGRIVVISAGNEGSNLSAGNAPARIIHATRTLSTGDTAQLSVDVPQYTPSGGSYNDYALFTLWYDARDTITVTVTRPNGTSFSRRTGEAAAADDNPDGRIYLDNASGGVSAQNGDQQVELQFFDSDPVQPPAVGRWRITVQMDRRGGNGRFDLWEYASSGTLFGASLSTGGDNGTIVGSPGNAARAITVGAHVTRVSWTGLGGSYQYIVQEQIGDLATFSSSGPSRPIRDAAARQKPEITAPGKGIFSTYSSQASPPAPNALIATDAVHVLLSGTSMSAPMVTGAVALLLERRASLTPEEVRAILASTARTDGMTSRAFNTATGSGVAAATPNASWGWGKLDVQAALAATPLGLVFSGGPRNDSLGGRFVLPRSVIPSLQLRFLGSDSFVVRVTRVRLRSSGSGNDAAAVTEVRLYDDADSSGTVGAGDALLGSATVGVDNGDADFTALALDIGARAIRYLLGTYSLNGTPANGQTFALSVDSASRISAERLSDGSTVSFNGAPVAGSVVRAQGIGALAATAGGALPSSVAAPGQENVTLLRRNATADTNEAVSVRRMVGRMGGTADPATTLANVRLVLDVNGNGVVDPADSTQATLATTLTGATLAASFSPGNAPEAGAGLTRRWLVAASLQATSTAGTTLSFRLDSLLGRGSVTDSTVIGSGLPLAGGTLEVSQTTLAISGPSTDTAVVLRDGANLPLARLRFDVQGEPVLVDSLRIRVSGTLSLSALTNIRMFNDRDGDGLQTGQLETTLSSGEVLPGGVIRYRMSAVTGLLPPGLTWWVIVADGANSATWGQTLQARLDTADIFARGQLTGAPPAKQGGAAVLGRFLRIGGQAMLTVEAGSRPPAAPLRIGPNPALQASVRATTLEGARLDSVRVAANSNNMPSSIVRSAALYLDSAGTGTIPSGGPLATLDDPFASGNTAVFAGLGLTVQAGGAQTLLVAVTLTDRLRQGDTFNISVTGVHATGLLSSLPAIGSIAASSVLGAAMILGENEPFLISENPVRSGRVIFSYDPTPRSIALYNFAGLKVREFTDLPPNRLEWHVRGESPGLPNGMYVVVVDTGTERLRRRIMLLSPAR